MIDIHNLTSKDTLTLDEALSATVLGYRVRADDMQPGAYIDYQFAGFRINFEGGSSSGWSRRPHDETVAWRVIDDAPVPTINDRQKWGRALRQPPQGDVLVMDHGKGWVIAAKREDSPTEPKPAPANVGKWGKAVVPKKDSWGRPLT